MTSTSESGPATATNFAIARSSALRGFESVFHRVGFIAKALGKAIEQATKNTWVSVQGYFRYADLVRAKPHMAILDPRCVVRSKATVLAITSVNGSTIEHWGL